MERLKPLQRNSSAAAAEPYRPELLTDDEPRYLRRQKPLEIRRKKFGGRGWPFYRRMLLWTVAGAATFTVAIGRAHQGHPWPAKDSRLAPWGPSGGRASGWNKCRPRRGMAPPLLQPATHSLTTAEAIFFGLAAGRAVGAAQAA